MPQNVTNAIKARERYEQSFMIDNQPDYIVDRCESAYDRALAKLNASEREYVVFYGDCQDDCQKDNELSPALIKLKEEMIAMMA